MANLPVGAAAIPVSLTAPDPGRHWSDEGQWVGSEAAKDPSWDRVKARLEWLMADPTMVTDDLIKTRQGIFQQPGWLAACEANMALQNLEIRKRNTHRRGPGQDSGAGAGAVDDQGPVRPGRR